MPIRERCDFCAGAQLRHAYTPIRSRRGMEVYVCGRCGLVQSFSTVPYQSRPPGSMSADADRSSYRYTKDVISDRYESVFSRFVDFRRVETVLDVGSNRGAFIRWLEARHPGKRITAIEPDASVTGGYADLPNVSLQARRFEGAQLPQDHFDLAYCAHTLEHVDSARALLLGVRRALKVGGLFFLAVPNLVFHSDIIEELFIDPHTYHFTFALLRNFVGQMGFSVEYAGEPAEADVVLLLKKQAADEAQLTFAKIDEASAARTMAEIANYSRQIHANRLALKTSAERLREAAKTHKVVIWGGGRILDALVKFGGLDLSKIYMVVDKFLCLYVNQLHGCKLESPRALEKEDPDSILVYIASRDYADEIRAEAGALGVKSFIQFGKT